MPIPCTRRAIAVPLLLALCGAVGSRAPAQDAPDERRVGQLLGQHCARCHNQRLANAGILTVSSSPRRTSPVFRGAWVLDVLLGEPPPPPPPDVPELPAEADGPATSHRALLEAHRANPVCAGCHARIDPYGQALEQYDAMGRLRPDPRDTSTTLFDGRRLDGADDLKRYLAGEKATGFVRHLVRRMLTYALGRRLTFPDDRTVEIILQHLEEEGWGAAAMIREIVLSDPFRFRRGDVTPRGELERPDSGTDRAQNR